MSPSLITSHDLLQTFEDYPQLEEVAHAFYEAIRLFRQFSILA